MLPIYLVGEGQLLRVAQIQTHVTLFHARFVDASHPPYLNYSKLPVVMLTPSTGAPEDPQKE